MDSKNESQQVTISLETLKVLIANETSHKSDGSLFKAWAYYDIAARDSNLSDSQKKSLADLIHPHHKSKEKSKYFVLLVQDKLTEPFFVEFGSHDKQEVKDELDAVKGDYFKHHILSVSSGRQVDIDSEIEIFNRGRGYETTCHRGLVKSANNIRLDVK
tara:strand:+ start:954 stop:1430 length:477 start_codon:yes stop_codon:yes gene_type:complete